MGKPCKCCDHKNGEIKNVSEGYGYNRLSGESREWAENNGMARSEFCVRVKGGKRFRGPEWIKQKCGDGRMGFSMRRRSKNEVQMEVGQDGQFKKARKTLVRRRSSKAVVGRVPRRVDGSRCGLVTSTAIIESMRDQFTVRERNLVEAKARRARNRNNRARRGHKRATKNT